MKRGNLILCLFIFMFLISSCEPKQYGPIGIFVTIDNGCDLPENNLWLKEAGNNIWEVWYKSSGSIGGFQFLVEGGELIDASGGHAGERELVISTGDNTVLAFGMNGQFIPSGCGNLVNLEFEGNPTGLLDIVFSDDIGEGLVPNFVYYLEPISGCTNESACNYNSDAEVDDESCEYQGENCVYNDCPTNPDNIDLNYDCEGACLSDIDDCGTCDDNLDNDCVLGCTNGDANNYDPDATDDNGSCEYGIGAEGGNLSFENASMSIPELALDENINFTIENIDEIIEASFESGDDYNIISNIYSFLPNNQSFNQNITISINYSITESSDLTFIRLDNEFDGLWSFISNGNFIEGIGSITVIELGVYAVSEPYQEICVVNGICEESEDYQNCPLDCAICGGLCGNVGISYETGEIEEACYNEGGGTCFCYCDIECIDFNDCCPDIDSNGDEGINDEACYNEGLDCYFELDDDDDEDWFNLVNESEYQAYCNPVDDEDEELDDEECVEGELTCSGNNLQNCTNQEIIIIECENGCSNGECLSEVPSCTNTCDLGYPSGCEDAGCICWCDSECSEMEDCCLDYESICVDVDDDDDDDDDDGEDNETDNENNNGENGGDENNGNEDPSEPQPLFDIKVTLLEGYDKVSPGDQIISNIQLFNFGDLTPVDVMLGCELRNFNVSDETIYDLFDETLAVDLQTSITRNMNVPDDASFGSYLINCKVSYNEIVEGSSSDAIFVVSKINTRMPSIQLLAILGLSILLIIALVIIIILILRIFNKKISKKIDYKKIKKRKK
jgi:hypothetical protein